MSVEHKPKPLPFVANFAAGAIAGISEILTFYPLDVVKTRMQLSTGKSQGLVGTLTSIIKEEGAGRLYRGLVPPLLLEAPKRAVKFAANDFWGKTFLDMTGESKMTQKLSILTGCSAGATSITPTCCGLDRVTQNAPCVSREVNRQPYIAAAHRHRARHRCERQRQRVYIVVS